MPPAGWTPGSCGRVMVVVVIPFVRGSMSDRGVKPAGGCIRLRSTIAVQLQLASCAGQLGPGPGRVADRPDRLRGLVGSRGRPAGRRVSLPRGLSEQYRPWCSWQERPCSESMPGRVWAFRSCWSCRRRGSAILRRPERGSHRHPRFRRVGRTGRRRRRRGVGGNSRAGAHGRECGGAGRPCLGPPPVAGLGRPGG